MIGTLVVTDQGMLRHDPGAGHPESPARLGVIHDALGGASLPELVVRTPRPAALESLRAVHDPVYVSHLLGLRGAARVSLDPDTHLSAGSVGAALISAGSVVEAVDAVLGGAARRAFALGRPPGHHAEAQRAMGFCLLNNVAIGVAHARQAFGVERILVIDWDVHCGNGTQRIFEADPGVLVFDAHRAPFYPFVGEFHDIGVGPGAGYTMNVPMPAGLGDGDYAQVFTEILAPAAERFRPQLVMVSAGYDAHREDPLGDQDLTDEGFAALTGIALGIADRLCQGRIVLNLEGGYALQALARSVVASLQVLGGSTPPECRRTSTAGDAVLRQAAAVARRHWRF